MCTAAPGPWAWLPREAALGPSLVLLLSLLVLAALRRSRGARTGGLRLPPSPPKLPLIGNLHQVGSCPHRSLAALSRRYGPLMLLRLGQVPTLVVSSAEMAEQVMKTHDTVFANRPQMAAARKLLYGCTSVAFSPYGEHWRNLRKIFKNVQTYKLARAEEVAVMIEKIERSSSASGVVDLTGVLQDFMLDLILRILHGRRFRDEGLSTVFRDVMDEHIALISLFHLVDCFPSLRWMIGVVTGLGSKVQKAFQKWDDALDSVIQKHVSRNENEEEDFVDVLLAHHKDPSSEFPLTMETIKGILLDAVSAGSDTTYITLDWAMAELIRSSEAMKRAQAEVREIAGAKPMVEEADTARMKYLRAVINETLRLHAPATLLLPHQSSQDTKIQGYDIPDKTTVLVNGWAIMRDPMCWEAPEEFRPERFLGAPLDFRGGHFHFIPFGSGRRICPGMQLAASVMELALANLLHRFDWELPDGMRGEDLDMAEIYGVTTRRELRLHLVAKPRAL